MRLSELFEQYHDAVQFINVYIREAHAIDGWWLGGGLPGFFFRLSRSRAAFDVYDPKTIEERREVAGACETALQFGVPTVVDEMDDVVNKAYAAAPTRLYLISLDGRVVYKGGLGPFGFKPKELKEAIRQYLQN